MPEGWLIQAVENFWTNVGELKSFPRSLESSVVWVLPLVIRKIPELRLQYIATWLKQNQMPFSIAGSTNRLHGCLVAYRGNGYIFLDEADSQNEKRFSLAHEVAHFILDYQKPRQKAIAELGPNIVEVLDGTRVATVDERITAILSDFTVGPYINLIERVQDGTLSLSQAIEIENRADRLALELLAPMDEVRQLVELESRKMTFEQGKTFVSNVLKIMDL